MFTRIIVISAPGDDALNIGEAWLPRVCLGRGGKDWGWLNLGIISFIFLTGGIGPGVHHVMFVAAPTVVVPASGEACFIRQVRSECLGVDWSICLCLGLGSGIGIFGGFVFGEGIDTGVP